MKLKQLLARLAEHQVRFSVIGGVALIARGVQRSTEYLDVAYARDRENLTRLAAALDGLERSKRAAGRPKDLVDLGYIRALRG